MDESVAPMPGVVSKVPFAVAIATQLDAVLTPFHIHIFFGSVGVLQFVVVPIEKSIAASLGASERQTFIGEEAVWVTLVIIFASFDFYWRWRVPPPRPGMVNMATVRAAQ
jgi:hypothetical protein